MVEAKKEPNLSGQTKFDPCVYFNPYNAKCLREDHEHYNKICPHVIIKTDICWGHD